MKSKRFELKLVGVTEEILNNIPTKWRSEFIREAIYIYSKELGYKVKGNDEILKAQMSVNKPTLEKLFKGES